MKMKKFPLLITLCATMVAIFSSGCGNQSNQNNSSNNSQQTGGGNNTPPVIDTGYYAAANGLTGESLKLKLNEINKPKSKSYDWSRYEAADEAIDDSSCVLSLYTRHNIKKGNHASSYSWDKWNREHIFVQSQYGAASTDNHNIFACEGKINGIRSDFPFGEVTHNSSYRITIFNHVTDCYFDKSHFEPCDEAKGEVARALLYGAVTYKYNINDMLSLSTALKWNENHPVTEREIKRNETVYRLQGNRNPFVDHPEYAVAIWGK